MFYCEDMLRRTPLWLARHADLLLLSIAFEALLLLLISLGEPTVLSLFFPQVFPILRATQLPTVWVIDRLLLLTFVRKLLALIPYQIVQCAFFILPVVMQALLFSLTYSMAARILRRMKAIIGTY